MLDGLKRLSQRLPNWLEAVVILSIAFGLSVLNSFKLAFHDLDFSDGVAVGTLVMEVFITAVCVLILYLRGWTLWRDFPFKIDLKNAGYALGVFILSYVAYAVLYNIVALSVGQDALHISKFTVTANIGLIIAVSLVNPLFEETFVAYYVFERLKNYGPFIFIAVSSLIRVSYHLYQGWIGVIGILPLGIVYAIAFWKTRNLMPLYLAHAAQDLIGLIGQSNQ